MLEKHRHLLLKFRREIVEDLLVDDVVVFLQSKFVLDSDDTEVIRGEQTSRRQAEKLLDILPKKGYESFDYFFTALNEKYPHLARLLESGASEDSYNNGLEGIDSPLQREYKMLSFSVILSFVFHAPSLESRKARCDCYSILSCKMSEANIDSDKYCYVLVCLLNKVTPCSDWFCAHEVARNSF